MAVVRGDRKVTCPATRGMMLSAKRAADGAPMGRSVEHLLLRLLTPFLLLFLVAHIVSPSLDGTGPAASTRSTYQAAYYLDDGSTAARAARPGKAQGRKGRFYDARPLPKPEPGAAEAETALASVLAEAAGERKVVALAGGDRPVVLPTGRRAQNPRDPPAG